jgi:hypothetical protein
MCALKDGVSETAKLQFPNGSVGRCIYQRFQVPRAPMFLNGNAKDSSVY